MIDKDGNYVANSTDSQDAFGHQQLGGIGDFLANYIESNLAVKARSSKLGTGQGLLLIAHPRPTTMRHSWQDKACVQQLLMVKPTKWLYWYDRRETYECETGLAPLSEIANGVKEIPADWISEDGVSMTAKFIKYCQPLIQGEVEVPYENGLPAYVRLSKRRVRKVLDPYVFD